MFRPSRRHRAAADDDRGLAVELEKNRQMAHGYRTLNVIAPYRPGARAGQGDIGSTGPL
jgi:hypothetical protein